MPHYQQTPRKRSQAQLWAKRSTHLRTYLDNLSLKKTQHIDAQSLIRVFFTRKSLRLKLSDTYLAKLWSMSLRNVQYRLKQFEDLGLIKRLTKPPQKRVEGWRQERSLFLILPKQKSKAYLVSKNSQQSNLQASPAVDSSTVPVKTLPNMKFVDYLALQNKVSKGAFAFWMRRWGAKPRSMGYLLDNIHSRIERRPDVLESVLWDAVGQKLSGQALVGFIVSEVKSRITT